MGFVEHESIRNSTVMAGSLCSGVRGFFLVEVQRDRKKWDTGSVNNVVALQQKGSQAEGLSVLSLQYREASVLLWVPPTVQKHTLRETSCMFGGNIRL